VAAVFLLVGALGIVVLLLSLFAGEIGDFVPALLRRLGGAANAQVVDGVTHVPVVVDGDGATGNGKGQAG
jgi:hypothetical protein